MSASQPDASSTAGPLPQTVERVAVIVVHGVADQAPNVSVRQVANLLAKIDDAGSGRAYSAFTEETIRVPVRRVPVKQRSTSQSFFDVCQAHNDESTDVSGLFTEMCLSSYKGEGPEATFQTVRLSATRRPVGAHAGADVDLFEMYWADLSRVGTSAWRILGEVYQVLLHLPSLGKHAASASVATDDSRPGRLFQKATAFASWMLTAPIAVFNVFFIVAGLLVLASLVPPERHQLVSAAIAAVAVVGCVIKVLLNLAHKHRVYQLLAAGAIIGGVTGLWIAREAPDWGSRLLGLEALCLGFAIVWLVLRAYAAYRPGIGETAVASGLVVAVAALAALVWNDGSSPPWFAWTAAIGFRIIEVLYVVLSVAWLLFFASVAVSVAAGSWYWRRVKGAGAAAAASPDAKQARETEAARDDRKLRQRAAARAVRTARVALAVPAAVFLWLTIALWAGLLVAIDRPKTSGVSPFDVAYQVWPPVQWLLPGVSSGRTFVSQVLASSLGSGFFASAILMGVGALLLILPLVPVMFAEVRHPRLDKRCTNDGQWLTEIFGALRLAGALVVIGVILLPVWQVLPSMVQNLIPAQFQSARIVQILGVAVAGAAAGLIGFRGRIQKLAGGFRAPVDVLLDVDGYLRQHPKDSTPRARVFARYFSLLTHIGQAQPPYTKVVVIAHSQGTVITADLLRYLNAHRKQDPALWPLGNIAVKLFTMGSPLRQLYARRFPEMYEWVRHESPDNGLTEVPDAPDIQDRNPAPESVGVVSWVNAYRSGDYVGRWLWRSDACRYLFAVAAADEPWISISAPLPGQSRDDKPTRREFCIGAGAHTHYWDGTAPAVATELDYLMRE